MSTPVRTRFAPSPTGSLHVGGVRTALYCLLEAKRSGGAFVLRIEDTDRVRSSDEATRGIVKDLQWLSLAWDEGPEVDGAYGPYLQSERLELYNRELDKLIEADQAYLAWETPAELAQMRREAEQTEAGALRYRRIPYTSEQLARFTAEGRTPVVRLAVPRVPRTVEDRVLGPVTLPADHADDFVIRKADGYPTYHFAVVVDDHHMEVDLVLRGQEHVMNTHKHLAIYEALGWTPPAYAHLPLIFNPNGSKMSKRDKAKAARAAVRTEAKAVGAAKGQWDWLAERTGLDSGVIDLFQRKKNDDVGTAATLARALGVQLPLVEVLDFRVAGVLPEALVNYLALLGWSPGDDREVMALDELVEAFSLDRVGRTPAKFDLDKLMWMSGAYMKAVPTDRLLQAMDSWLEVVDSPLATASLAARAALLELYRPRVSTFAQLDAAARFFFVRPTEYDAKAVRKHIDKGGGVDRLRQARDALGDTGRWEAPSIERTITALCEATGAGLGKVAQPIRIAISGTPVTPPLFDVLALLDRDETLERIDAFLAAYDARSAPTAT